MALVTKNDVTQIFAIQAPEVDLPPTFANYPRGWDTARSNNGKPTIKQFNYIQQRTDQNVLWIHQNGAALPYDAAMEYAENAHVVKDGELQKKQGASWVSATNKGYNLDYFVAGKSYPLHAEIMLENGDIVKSTVANNTTDPNFDMTGWINTSVSQKVFIFPQDDGAKFDGVTSDSAALNLASIRAESVGGTIVLSGKVLLTTPVDVKSNIDGRGATVLAAGNSNFDLFTITDKLNLKISDLEFEKTGATNKRGVPIKVSGSSEDICLENILADGFNSTIVAINDYNSALNAKFKFSVTNTATGGSWKVGFVTVLTMGEIAWTTSLPHNATAAQLQSALDISVGAGNTLVAKTGNDFIVEFIGAYAGSYVPPPYFSYALSGMVMYGGAVDIIQYGGGKFVKNLTLTNVKSKNAGEYGLSFGYVDGLTIDNCKATHSWFDGIKFIRQVRNVDINGGYYCFNGESFFTVGTNQSAGDGIDMYAGGENVRLLGGVYNFNRGLGIQIKNDDALDLSGYAGSKYGMCRKLDFIGVESSFNSVVGGIGLTTNKSGDTSYSVTDVNIIGGRYEGNAVYGININGGQRVTLTDVKANRNGGQGIVVTQYSKFVDINNCTAVANGSGAGTGVGLLIQGKNVTVNGGLYLGCDSDGLTVSTDLSLLVKNHVSNIRIDATASDVTINMPTEAYNSSGRGILVSGSPTNVTIHQKPTENLVPNSSLIYGGIGSTITTLTGQKYTKVSGDVSSGVWRSAEIKQSTTLTVSTTITAGFDLYIIRAQSADTVVTLPLSNTVAGLSVKFMLYTNTGFKGQIIRQGADTINGGSVGIDLVDYGATCELTATSTGWIVSSKS